MAQWHLVGLIDMCDICISSFVSNAAADRTEKEGKNKVDLVLLFIYVGASDFCDSFLFDACAPNVIAQKLLSQNSGVLFMRLCLRCFYYS